MDSYVWIAAVVSVWDIFRWMILLFFAYILLYNLILHGMTCYFEQRAKAQQAMFEEYQADQQSGEADVSLNGHHANHEVTDIALFQNKKPQA